MMVIGLIQIFHCFAANHLNAPLRRGLLRCTQLFTPHRESIEQMGADRLAGHFRAGHHQLPVMPHFPQLPQLGRPDFGRLFVHKDHVTGGLCHPGLHGRRGPATGLMTRHTQLGVLERQFVSDFFRLIGGGIIHNQDFKSLGDVREDFQKCVYIVGQGMLSVMDRQYDAEG